MPTPKKTDRSLRRQQLKAETLKPTPEVAPGTVDETLDYLARKGKFADAKRAVAHLLQHPELSALETMLVNLVCGGDAARTKKARAELVDIVRGGDAARTKKTRAERGSKQDRPTRLKPHLAWELGKAAYDEEDWETFLEVASRANASVHTVKGAKLPRTNALGSAVVSMLRDVRKGGSDARALLAAARRVPGLCEYVDGANQAAAIEQALQLAVRCAGLPSGAARRSALQAIMPTILKREIAADLDSALSSSELVPVDLAFLVAQTGALLPQSSAQSTLIHALARAKRGDVIQREQTWEGLDLIEVAALLAVENVYVLFEPRPAWWSDRLKAVLAKEGIGAVLRAIHIHSKSARAFDLDWLVETASRRKLSAEASVFEALARHEVNEAVAAARRLAAADVARAVAEVESVTRELHDSKRRENERAAEVAALSDRLRRGVSNEIVSRSAQDMVAQTAAVEALIRVSEQIRLASTVEEEQAINAAVAAHRLVTRELGALGVVCPGDVGEMVPADASLYDATSGAGFNTSSGIVRAPAYVRQVGDERIVLRRGILHEESEPNARTKERHEEPEPNIGT